MRYDRLRLVEQFVSINGEGQRAGELALFLRFAGCDLRCSYCDTMWANEPGVPVTEMTPDDLAAAAFAQGITNVTLTGGEPLLQKALPALIDRLHENGHRVEIETNGAVPIAPVIAACGRRPVFTMDYKLPSSGMEQRMCLENMAHLDEADTVKFVCGSREDLARAAAVMRTYDLIGRTHVYLSPVFGQIDPQEMVAFMMKEKLNDVRLQLQLHKFIWDPNERGV